MSSAKVVCCIFSTNIPCRWKIQLEHEGSIDLPLFMYVAVVAYLAVFIQKELIKIKLVSGTVWSGF